MRRHRKETSFFHRLFLLGVILILPVFLVKEYRIIRAKKETNIQATQKPYVLDIEPQEDKKFTFLVLTYDNKETIEQNFQSIMTQSYPSFRVVYLDQGSTDGTISLIKSLIAKEDKKNQITLIEREKDYQVFESYYEVVQKCSDDDVMIHLHGSDWLAHTEVLNCLNHTYSNPDVWLTYGQYLDYHSYKKGTYNPQPKKNIYKKKVQRAPWVVAHFKTFYAGFFKKARRKETVSSEFFFTIENEKVFLLPLAEMGKAHVQFIPDVLYIHSQHLGKKRQGMKLAFILGKMTESLHQDQVSHQSVPPADENIADIIIFSKNRPDYLSACLKSLVNHLEGAGHIHVIYTCLDLYLDQYEKLNDLFPAVSFIRPTHSSPSNFKACVLESLIGAVDSPPYVLLATDLVVLNRAVSLKTCVEAMRKTRAYGFYLHLDGKERTRETVVEGGIYSWVIGWEASQKGGLSRTFDMGLYQKIDLERDFKEMDFCDEHDLFQRWAELDRIHRIGLSFDQPKAMTAADD